MLSDPFVTSLFPPGTTDPTAPGNLYGRTTTLFARGSYVPNPTSDPSTGSSLATWWKSAWDTWRAKVPARETLPAAAGKFDKIAVDNLAEEIVTAMEGLEGANSRSDARGYANLIEGKFELLQSMLPLNALEAVPKLAVETAGLRDASFSASRAVIARSLNYDRPGESVGETYRKLQLVEAASLHYEIGGDPPTSFEIPKGETSGNFLHWASSGLNVPFANQPKADLGAELASQLMIMEGAEADVQTLSAIKSRTPKEEANLKAKEEKLGTAIETIANLSRAFSVETWELAKKHERVSERVEMAMVAAEAMREVTGTSRSNAKPSDPSRPGYLTNTEMTERATAAAIAEKHVIMAAPKRDVEAP